MSDGAWRESTAALVVIGDEILSGKTEDTNSRYLIRRLRELGVRLARILVLPDEDEVISAEVSALQARFDIVFTSGGIGPTHDDRTIPSIAAALGREVVTDAKLEARLRAYYGERINDARLRMARVPEGTEIILDPENPIPVFKVENIYIFPGVPQLFERCFESVAERFTSAPFYQAALYTSLGEGDLAPHLERCLADIADVAIGSYPRLTPDEAGWRVKITFESRGADAVERALARLTELIGTQAVVNVDAPGPVRSAGGPDRPLESI